MEKQPLLSHQPLGIKKLSTEPWFALMDEPGTAKSRQVIEAAQYLWHNALITCLLIVCPAQVKINWLNPTWGEISLYHEGGCHVQEICAKPRYWVKGDGRGLLYYIVSYEYLRSRHLNEVCQLVQKEKLMVCFDEGSWLRNRSTKQWKAAVGVRYGKIQELVGKKMKWVQKYKPAERCVLLNGSPVVTDGILDLWAQLRIVHPSIIPEGFWMFRRERCILGGFQGREIVGYRDIDGTIKKPNEPPPKFLESLTPYLLCRKKSDIMDLPPKTLHVEEVALSPDTWRIYKEMRDELIVEFEQGEAVAVNGGVKAMRLGQITAGYLARKDKETKVVTVLWESTEKRDWLEAWLKRQPDDQSTVLWHWWRHHVETSFSLLTEKFSTRYYSFKLLGGLNDRERDESVRYFNPGAAGGDTRLSSDPRSRPAGVLSAQIQAGGMGLNFARASANVYMSSWFHTLAREQSEERFYRPGQVKSVRVIDLLATGPKGQRTIDHMVYDDYRQGVQFSSWTKDQWIKKLREE